MFTRGTVFRGGKYAVNSAAKVHITGKPLALLKDLMGIATDGGTALAPSWGGRTTAHAAILTGRKCIGVELSPDYARLSAERLLEHFAFEIVQFQKRRRPHFA